MTEDEGRQWIIDRFGVSRETRLASFIEILRSEGLRQNLIAPSTFDQIWVRHIVDSAQLLLHAPVARSWVDVGSGAGLPGMVIAILTDAPIDLVEPRRLRTEFMVQAATQLSLDHVTVTTAKIENTTGVCDVITARAVTNLDRLLRITRHRAGSSTIWLLPKGRNAQSEVEEARRTWQGSFHVEPSITAPDSLIVVAQGIQPK